MAGRDRVDFYRNNRDYSNILDEDDEPEEMEEEEEEYEEEDDEEARQYEKSEPDEDPVVVRERQEYLERREKLKEVERQKLRQKLKQKLSDQTLVEKDNRKKLPYNDDYGSFFGPSEIVVARRVIVETRARNEASCIAPKVSKEDPKRVSEPESDAKFEEKEPPPRKVVDETKTKAQQLKAIRDYSFLFSDNAEIPVPDKVSTSDPKSVTKSIPGNVQQKQTIGKNSAGALKKPVVSSKPISSSKETKGIVKPSGHLSAKAGSRAISPHPNLNGSSNPKNQVSKLGSGLGRSVIQANGSLRHPGINGTKAVNPGSNGVKGGNLDVVKKKDLLLNASKVGKDHQRLSGSQPTNMQKVVPIKAPSQTFQVEQRKPPVMVKSSSKPVQKLDTKMPPKQAPKPAPKPLPKPQVKPAKAPLSRESHYDRPKKRKPLDDDYDDHEDGNVSSIIRRMFGYDPNKYRNMDDEDDRDMEVGFSSIQAEERRSERIAREEDERELALIEAEERAERERAIKKRKLQRK